MRIAIASGKGGTGKSTVAMGIAIALERAGKDITLADCDVEAPNLYLFLPEGDYASKDVTVQVPSIDGSKCVYCGKCAEFCKFNAISVFPGHALVFPELCHSCGGCSIVCPEAAISYKERKVGVVKISYPPIAKKLKLITGIMNENEHSSVPVISAVKSIIDNDSAGISILDLSPGTSCNMIAAVRGCDHCILVTEPTPFGLHDLKLAVEVLRHMGIPSGVVINKSYGNDSLITDYCAGEGIEIYLRIPYDDSVAKFYSNGTIPSLRLPWLSDMFRSLYDRCIKDGGS